MPGTTGLLSVAFMLMVALLFIPADAIAVNEMAEGEIRITTENQQISFIPASLDDGPVSRTIMSGGPVLLNTNRQTSPTQKKTVVMNEIRYAAWKAGRVSDSSATPAPLPIMKKKPAVKELAVGEMRMTVDGRRFYVTPALLKDRRTRQAIAALDKMEDQELNRASVSRYEALYLNDEDKSMDNPQEMDDMFMSTVTAGNSVKVVFHELHGEIYVRGCEFKITPLPWEDLPEKDFLLNWRLMNYYKVYRNYFDVGLENYGWSLTYEKPGDNYFKELNNRGFVDGLGNPLHVDTVLFMARMLPRNRTWKAEKDYFPAWYYRRADCQYHKGFFIIFDIDDRDKIPYLESRYQ